MEDEEDEDEAEEEEEGEPELDENGNPIESVSDELSFFVCFELVFEREI